jgi:hypothetical protein
MSRTLFDFYLSGVPRQSAGYACVAALALAAMSVGLTGCGDGGPERVAVYKAQGQLLWEGKPLPNALIVLHPQGAADPKALSARAQTDANGNFALSTYDAADGAPLGDFAVTVAYYPPVQVNGAIVPGPNALPPRYADPTTTDLRLSIREGENQLPPLSIRR